MPILVALLLVRRLARRREAEALHDLEAEGVILVTRKANFFGARNRSVFQMRGNGILVLTRKSISFFMLLPSRRISIPLEQVDGVSHPKSFRMRAVGKELLAIKFHGSAGDDEIGLYVPDPRRWGEEILAARDR